MNSLLAPLGGLARGALLCFLLLGLGLASLAWNLIALVLWPLLPPALGRALGRAGICRGYALFWAVAQGVGMMRIDARELRHLSEERDGLIVAANHPSMLDALLVIACLPRGVCIMKASLMRNVFLGAGARLARYIRNDSPRGMIGDAVQSLREGAQLVVFPEGTRSVRRPINPFLPGVTLIAQRAQVPIQTVIIETDSPYLGKGWPIWHTPPACVGFKLRLGERFAPQADHAELLRRIETYFARELQR
jgi:1-acyl-sn-glycerol-3-phosphate acyltransferase